MTSIVVLYDACVLYPAALRDLLIRLARTGILRAKWTNEILDECFRNILENRPDLSLSQLKRTRALMNLAVPDCLVTGYEKLIPALNLPDPDDRHVLAAAIKARAAYIVTRNKKDFPQDVMERHGIVALDPDRFVLDLLKAHPTLVTQVLEDQLSALRNPPLTLEQLLDHLHEQGIPRSVKHFRDLPGR